MLQLAATITVIICLLAILFGVFFAIRNEWVFKKRTDWNNRIYSVRIRMLEERNPDYDKYSYQNLLDALESYGGMMKRFWCYNINKLITDDEKYNFVINNLPKETHQ